jgi:hypothetical protein
MGLWSRPASAKSKPYIQNNQSKKGWGVGQAVKALNSNPNTTKKYSYIQITDTSQ